MYAARPSHKRTPAANKHDKHRAKCLGAACCSAQAVRPGWHPQTEPGIASKYCRSASKYSMACSRSLSFSASESCAYEVSI